MNNYTTYKTLISFAIVLFFSTMQSNGTLGNMNEIYQQAVDQTDEIDLILELLTEVTDKGKLHSHDKKGSLRKLENMRTIINDFKDTASQNSSQIIGINEIMLRGLEFMTGNNFKVIPAINNTAIVRSTRKPLTEPEAHAKLKANAQRLNAIQTSIKNIGLSTLNIITRSTDKIMAKLSIDKTLIRLAPYGLIMLYMLYVTRKEQVKTIKSYLPESLANAIIRFKELIGTAPYIKQEHKDSTAPEVDDRDQFQGGAVSSVNNILNTGNFLKIEIEPILKWAPAASLLSLTARDWNDSIKFIKKKFNWLYSKLKNERIEDDNIFAKPALSSDSLDFNAIPEFKNIINYFKYKHLFDLADHSIDKSYLFVGHQATGYFIADILCATLAQELAQDCRIIELNASDFVPARKSDDSLEEDKLTTVLNNNKKYDLNVIVIKDIDWIYKQKGQTIVKLDRFLSDITSKNNCILIGLTNRIHEVGDNAKNKLTRFDLDNFNELQRFKFIKAQLKAHHATQDMDIESIAKQTENCNLADLKKIAQNAYTLSFTEHKPFNKRHLAQSTADMLKMKNKEG